MSNDLNRCEFIGRLGKDPESRFMPSGEAVVNFSIAVGKSWKDKQSGEKKESTAWVPIVVFGGLAGVCSTYLKKGSRIYVAGEFRVRKWQAQDGSDRYTTEIVASEMQMLDSRAESSGGAGATWPIESGDGGRRADNPPQNSTGNAYREASGGTARKPPPSAAGSGFDDFDDDIPFN